MDKTIAGIDYGSKMAGTSVLCFNDDEGLVLLYSEKKKSADEFLINQLNAIKPDLIMMDAPLSLPGAYFGWKGYNNFHYRNCDLELKAMSPMFLGGLTARAISLQSVFEGRYSFLESYPGAFIRKYFPEWKSYKKEKAAIDTGIGLLREKIEFPELKYEIDSWHAFDALLCWISGLRFVNGEAVVFGKKKEGQIYI